MAAPDLITLAARHSLEVEIRKSRFCAHALPLPLAVDDAVIRARDLLQQVSDAKATHNCWAYLAGEQYRFSDDGEPGGTAGRPILAAIEGQGVDHVLVVVTRYFGGIKLGAGGLVRAYGNTAAECLRQAPRLQVRPRLQVVLEVPFEALGALYDVLGRFASASGALTWGQEEYLASGQRLSLDLEEALWPRLRMALEDATRGQVRFQCHSGAAKSKECE